MRIRCFVNCAILHLAILRSAGLLAPRRDRDEWLAGWKSELWYVLQRSNHGAFGCWDVLCFSLGAFKDAMWLRRNNPDPDQSQTLWLQSPARCASLLAVLAAGTTLFFFRGYSAGTAPAALFQHLYGQPVLAHILVVIIALLILPATTTLTFGEYPATAQSPARVKRLRRWAFLVLKFALILAIVFCGAFDLAHLLNATAIQPHAALVGYVLGFRWVLLDQRRRCPVCLRLLANPTRIGCSAQTFLEWYGTEFVCMRGPGLLHVPEVETSCSRQRWLDLDLSWSSLFS